MMDLSWLGVAWLCGACLCLAAGMQLTRQRMQEARGRPKRQQGCPCGASLNVNERFCGQCGRRTSRNRHRKGWQSYGK
jgi:hypothetical protein